MALGDDGPRFNRKKTRVQVALAKYYGMGDEEPWAVNEIADYLNVEPETVSRYIHDSDLSDEVEDKLADVQARTRMRLATKMMTYLDELDDLIEDYKETKDIEVQSHKLEDVEAEVQTSAEGLSVGYGDEEGKKIDAKVPVADKFTEVTDFDKLKDPLRERRMVIEQLEDLLGLEEPEKVESEHREVSMEKKVWDIDFSSDDEDDLPEPEIVDETEKEEILLEVEEEEDG